MKILPLSEFDISLNVFNVDLHFTNYRYTYDKILAIESTLKCIVNVEEIIRKNRNRRFAVCRVEQYLVKLANNQMNS